MLYSRFEQFNQLIIHKLVVVGNIQGAYGRDGFSGELESDPCRILWLHYQNEIGPVEIVLLDPSPAAVAHAG